MANSQMVALGKKGWKASKDKWIRLISKALEERGITAHWVYIERIVRKVFSNNRMEGGNIGWETIDSYVGYLQATDQLGVPIKSHKIMFHRDTLNFAPRFGGQVKKFDASVVFGHNRPKSTEGTRIIRSKSYGK